MFVTAVVSDNFTEAMGNNWDVPGTVGYGGESPVKWKQSDAHGTNTGILPEVSWWAWDSSLMGYRPRGTGDRSCGWTGHRLLAQFHCEAVAQARGLRNRVGQEWYHGSDISLWQQEVNIWGEIYIGLHSEPSSFIKSG